MESLSVLPASRQLWHLGVFGGTAKWHWHRGTQIYDRVAKDRGPSEESGHQKAKPGDVLRSDLRVWPSTPRVMVCPYTPCCLWWSWVMKSTLELAKMCSQDGPCPAACMQTPFLFKYLSRLRFQKELFLPHSFLCLEVYLRFPGLLLKELFPGHR